jgi:cytochrome c oxidase cbb3-type subunit 3
MSDNDPKPDPDQPRTALYASRKDEVVLRPHVYDGIQEYDQKLPNWWLFTFYGAIVWFVVFWIAYYQFDLFRSDTERIDSVMAEIEDAKNKELEELLADLDDESLVSEWATRDTAVANGQDTYMTHCSACHSQDLTAQVAGVQLPGLSLKDGEWKYGGKPMEVFTIINDGSPPESEGHNGARMEAWGQKLSPKSVAELTAFIIASNEEEFSPYRK